MSSSCLKMGEKKQSGGVLPSGKHTKNYEQSPCYIAGYFNYFDWAIFHVAFCMFTRDKYGHLTISRWVFLGKIGLKRPWRILRAPIHINIRYVYLEYIYISIYIYKYIYIYFIIMYIVYIKYDQQQNSDPLLLVPSFRDLALAAGLWIDLDRSRVIQWTVCKHQRTSTFRILIWHYTTFNVYTYTYIYIYLWYLLLVVRLAIR